MPRKDRPKHSTIFPPAVDYIMGEFRHATAPMDAYLSWMDQLFWFGGPRRGALFTYDRAYRFALWRVWGDTGGPMAMFVGLNPSTADEHNLDNTLRRCKAFAKREGCVGFMMVNTCGHVATKPKDLTTTDRWANFNTDLIVRLHASTTPTVLCWGQNKPPDNQLLNTASQWGDAECFGRTRDGSPKHPLYLSVNTPLEPFSSGISSGKIPTKKREAERRPDYAGPNGGDRPEKHQ